MPGRSTGGRRKPTPSRARARHVANTTAQPLEPQPDNDVASAVDNMIEFSKKRRDAKRTGLRNEHHARQTEIQEAIDNAFSNLEENSLQARKAQVERLITLLKRKDDIESRMAASVKTVERAHLARSVELRAAIDDRIAKLR